MKKKYENYDKITFSFVLFLISLLIVCSYFFGNEIVTYKVFSGVVYKEDILVFVLSNEELKLFNKNKKLFIENKSRKFLIKNIEKNVLERNGDKYNQVFINTDISDMYKVNDVINISIMDKRVKCYKIFSIIWEGD